MPRPRKPASPFRYFNSSPEVIRLVVMMYVRFPLSLRNVEDLLFERGIDIHLSRRLCQTKCTPTFLSGSAQGDGAESCILFFLDSLEVLAWRSSLSSSTDRNEPDSG